MGDSEYYGASRDLHDIAHCMKRAARHFEHDMRRVDRERKQAVRDALRAEMSGMAAGPRTVEDALVEIDAYVSYLEDLPAERLAPYGERIDAVAAHLGRVIASLEGKTDAR